MTKRLGSRAVALVVTAFILFTAELAMACPVCAQRDEAGGIMRNIALGVLILTPWIVALTVGLYIRRGLASVEVAAGLDSETRQ